MHPTFLVRQSLSSTACVVLRCGGAWCARHGRKTSDAGSKLIQASDKSRHANQGGSLVAQEDSADSTGQEV